MSLQSSSLPLVSVVIPCYNCEEFVCRAVTSVLGQTHPMIELLLIDNNSTDGTYALLKELERKHPGKITVYSEKNKGACAARNLGLYKSHGEWIQFLDADDQLLSSKIESQLQLVTVAKTDVVASDYFKIGAKSSQSTQKKVAVEDDPWLGIINSTMGVTSALLWKREKLVAVNGWSTEISSSQEYDLLFRLMKEGVKIKVLHQAHTIIYGRPESVSRTASAGKLFQILCNRYDLRCRIYAFLKENNLLKTEYKQQLHAYLYYHLLLISELNMPYFKEQVKSNGFEEIDLVNKIKAFFNFIRHSSKRRYGYSNAFMKIVEWQYFFCKNIYLLKF